MWTMKHRRILMSCTHTSHYWTVCFFFRIEKTKSLSSKNKFKATFYLNHNDNSAKTHHKDTWNNLFFFKFYEQGDNKNKQKKPQRSIPNTLPRWIQIVNIVIH